MKRILAVAFGAAVLVGGVGPAEAAQPASHCKVLGSSSQTQTRDVTGVTAGATVYGPVRKVGTSYVRTVTRYFWSGVQSRTVTTTAERCRGKVSTSTTSTAWSGARIVTTTSTERVR